MKCQRFVGSTIIQRRKDTRQSLFSNISNTPGTPIQHEPSFRSTSIDQNFETQEESSSNINPSPNSIRLTSVQMHSRRKIGNGQTKNGDTNRFRRNTLVSVEISFK